MKNYYYSLRKCLNMNQLKKLFAPVDMTVGKDRKSVV